MNKAIELDDIGMFEIDGSFGELIASGGASFSPSALDGLCPEINAGCLNKNCLNAQCNNSNCLGLNGACL